MTRYSISLCVVCLQCDSISLVHMLCLINIFHASVHPSFLLSSDAGADDTSAPTE